MTPITPPLIRFFRFVRIDDSCWRWKGFIHKNGYGAFQDFRRSALAHRFSYMNLVGPIPKGLTIDHLCRTNDCVNPLHMELVSHRENIMRGNGEAYKNSIKTHCKRGHSLSGYNLKPNGEKRSCRTCHNLTNRNRRRKCNN